MIVQESDEEGRSQLRVVLPPGIENDVEVRNAKFRE
jgi:hypothetical protein